MRTRAIAAIVLSVLLAGCGSTSKKSESTSADRETSATTGADTDLSLEGAGPTDAGAPGTDGAAPGGTAKPGTPAKPGTGGTPGSGGTTGTAAASGAPKVSPGVTKTEVLIGVAVAENGGAANAAFGYAGIGQIDGRKVWEAVIAEINKAGGVAGRKIKPVFYALDGTDFSTTTDTHNQRMCSTWTEDNHVFVAFASGDVLNACLAKKGVPQVVAIGGGDTAEFAAHPRLFSVAGVASDRMARFVVDRLAARGYYKNAKLGLVVYTTPTFERAGKVMVSELSKHNVKPAAVANIKPRENVVGANDEIAAIRSAVLKFKTDGITHVQFMSDASAWVQLNFMKAAQEQQFFPRYGLTSNDGGQTLSVLIGADSRPQLVGSLGVGWFPIFDVRAQDYPDSPPLARCKQIARAVGQEFSDPTRNTEAQAAGICDQLFFFDAAAEAGAPDVTYESFRAGAEKITGFAVANTFKSSMSATRHDGVGSIRLTEWFRDCECFKYTSGEQRV